MSYYMFYNIVYRYCYFVAQPIKWYNVRKKTQYASLGKKSKYYNM